MNKHKPTGVDFESFCERWDALGREGKVALAKECGVTYGTAANWRLTGQARPETPTETAKSTTDEIVGGGLTAPEILAAKPVTQLDFVMFDLETSNFNADFSIILAACIKPFGQPPIVFRADNYPAWKGNRQDDRAITQAITEELRRHAVVVTHFGSTGIGFDLPYLQAKMARYGLFPMPPMFAIDTWRIAKRNFKVASRRLAGLAAYFDAGEKSGVEGKLWMAAAYGDLTESKAALDRIVLHNIADVELLERLAALSFPYLKSIPKL